MADADRGSSGRIRQVRCTAALVLALSLVVITAACSNGGNDPSITTSAEPACSATAIAEKLLPSVVTISVHNGAAGVSGSGEVIRSDGQILTNSHVIASAASGATINVLFTDGTLAPASITGRDPQTDIGVIKVNVATSRPPIPFGSSSSVEVGEPVVALGAPLGLTSTVTSGIVSALGRTVTVAGDNGQSAVLLSAVQTDAAINPGNSGGALANCSGQMIGMPSAAASVTTDPGAASSGNIGLGFAIPVDLAKAVSDELIAHGAVTHSYFGMEVVLIPASSQSGKPAGLYVTAVAPGGPAANAGLVIGDVITAVEGKPAKDPTALALLTLTKKPGDTVTVTYSRAGTSANAVITMGTPPPA